MWHTPKNIEPFRHQMDLPDKSGVTKMTLSRVINFKMTSKRLMRAIADELGRGPKVVFARYYKSPKRRPRRNTRRSTGRSQYQEVLSDIP